jgi:hypothetical protein
MHESPLMLSTKRFFLRHLWEEVRNFHSKMGKGYRAATGAKRLRSRRKG